MRTLHRLCAILAVTLMFYLGATGTLMQTLDLRALLTHAPASDPTMQSIREGMYGQGNFQVITVGDFTAANLPQDLDYGQALGTVLQALHKQSPDSAPRFVELRVADGVTIGQLRVDNSIGAFNAQTGAEVAGTDIKPTPPPPSLRQTTKEIHRFWIRGEFPGVWVELVCGVALWVLLISGLVMYFQLLRARWKLRRRQLFWRAGGWWRSLHRAVSVVAAVFLLAIAFSGTWLAFESVFHSLVSRGPTAEASAPLSDGEVQQMATAALAALRRLEPQTPIKVLRLRVFGQMKQGVAITGGEETRQLVFNTDTGQPVSLHEPGYPRTGFPFGIQMHEDIKHFHSGQLFGLTARWMDLFAGMSLIFLSVSGLTMYLELWGRRRKTNRRSFFWL